MLDFSFHFDKELLPYQASMTFGDMAIIYAVESGMGRFYFEIQFLVSGPDEGEWDPTQFPENPGGQFGCPLPPIAEAHWFVRSNKFHKFT